MNTSLFELRKHFKVKKELETYGLSRSFMVLYKGWIITGFIIGVALIAGIISPDLSSHLSGLDVVTAIIAIGALVLGYQQWQAARHEVSLDKFYERLQFINQKLYEWPVQPH